MSTPKVYFISGANRPNGLGFNLAKKLAAQASSLVFAGVRDPTAAKDLTRLADERKNLIVVKLDATSETDAQKAAELVAEKAGKLDVLIPCAGVCPMGSMRDQSLDDLREAFEVNTVGPLVLYRAFQPLLAKSEKPVFMPISSKAGCFAFVGMPMPTGFYGVSKCALNYLTAKLNAEDEKLCAFVCSPGIVMTDMTTSGMIKAGMPPPPKEYTVELDDSVDGMIKVIGEAQRETHGGKFIEYDGQSVAW